MFKCSQGDAVHLLLVLGTCFSFYGDADSGTVELVPNDVIATDADGSEPIAPPKRVRKIPSWIPISHESNIYVDLVFLVDGSGSVTEENFSAVKKWIRNVSRAFDISSGIFQIGIVQYSHWYRFRGPRNQRFMKTEIRLGDCQDQDCLESRLRNTTVMGYTTFTGFAINKTVKEDFAESRNFNISRKILVLLTDGPSRDNVYHAANYARNMNITIFCVGVAQYNIAQLQLIANGELGNNLRIYPVEKFEGLSDIVGSIQSEIKSIYLHPVCRPLTSFHGFVTCDNLNNVGSRCQFTCDPKETLTLFGSGSRRCMITPYGITWGGEPSTCGICDAKFDLLLILDSSSSVSPEDFTIMKEFLREIVGALSIGVDHVQVSCIRYHNRTIDEFEYNDFKTKESLIAALDDVDHDGKGTYTGKALRHAVENKFAPQTGRRSDVPHLTILITDGPAKDQIEEYAAKLKQVSRVISIGLSDAKQNEIDEISSQPGYSVLSNYQQLRNPAIVWETVNMTCTAVDVVKETSCLPLEEPEYSATDCIGGVSGSINGSGEPVGMICSLRCVPGYKTTGKAEAFCDYSGNWIKKNWTCIEKDCLPLTVHPGVIVDCVGNKIDSICKSKCKPGYIDIQTEDNIGSREVTKYYAEYIHTCDKIESSDPKWTPAALTCSKNETCADAVCNHGKCLTEDNEFVCECDSGYTGMFCERNIDECESSPCRNGGTCKDKEDGYECQCLDGFEGVDCEYDVDECREMLCQNEAECNNTLGSFKCNCLTGYNCTCVPGYSGTNCSININDCESATCLNGGKCRDDIDYYHCDCAQGYTGEQCEAIIDECGFFEFDCSHHGKCRNTASGAICDCDAGYTGNLCQTNIDDCVDHSCQNGAICKDMVHNYTCECAEGYSGEFCDVVCSPNPCRNNGTCIEKQDSLFTCSCLPGYIGQLCEVYHNECNLKPCKNGARCSPESHTYSCACLDEYTGVNCTEDVDECESDPPKCKNGATCNNTFGGFNCTCQKGFWGNLCDEELCFLPKNASTVGEMSCTNDDKPGSVCVLRCPETWRVAFRNRQMGPDLTLTCHKNGTWSNSTEQFLLPRPKWECVEMRCPSPEPEENGPVKFLQVAHDQPELTNEETHTINCTNGTMVGSICTLKCHSSFSLVGQQTRICNAYGVWEGTDDTVSLSDAWKCKQHKCIRPVPRENSHVLRCTDELQPGSICRLVCMPNFQHIGPQNKTCTENFKWETGGKWGCEEVRCNENLPAIPNGGIVCTNGQRLYTICSLRCNPGYLLEVNGVIICQQGKNGTFWTFDGTVAGITGLDRITVCKRSECDFEVDLKTGNHTVQDFMPDFITMLKPPKREQESEPRNTDMQECDIKAIIGIRIATNESVSIQLWYGESAKGYLTMISTEPTTEGFKPIVKPREYLLTATGTGDGTANNLLTSGFSGLGSDFSMGLPKVEFPSTVNLTLSLQKWSWTSSREQWNGNLDARPKYLNRVYFGMNSVVSTKLYHETSKNAGLCYICLKKQHNL